VSENFHTHLGSVCENALAWMCHPDPPQGQAPVPALLVEGYQVLGMASQGNHRGLPLRARTALRGQMGIARIFAETPLGGH